ncbi:tetratricopeptide repeat protein, partial [Actinomadura rayongensis]|uniref:tetratricopeptide repeat protein n=1 Tax=Actinomadura rayongensis TaxID=1429076 RepID=UPI0035EC3221
MGDAEGHRVDSSVIGGHNIQIGSAAGDVTVVLERSRFRLELLAPSPVPERIPRSQRTPSHLLDVRRQVVPYRPRPTLEQALHTWRDDDEPVSVRLASGPGGAGKTRLAGWLATRSHDDGWTVLLASDTSTTLPPAAATHALAEDGRPLLAVVDYAERWPLESLTELVETLAAQHRVTGVRVRVLLLARPQREFWEGVAAQLERAWVDLAQPIAVEAFITGPEELSEAFTSAAGAFQAALELPVGPVPVPRGLSPEGGISPLTVHMAALAAVCATAEGEAVPQSEDLSGFLLAHERRYWKDPPGARVMSTMVMVATLFGPTSAGEQARQWLIRARLAADDTEAEHLLTAHHRLYPPLPDPAPDMTSVSQARPAPDTARVELLTPLKPDRFAEDFLAAHLIEPRAAVLLAELLTDPATASAQRQAFLVLSAAAARHTTARRALFAVLEAGPIPTAWLSPTLISTVISHAPDHLAARVETAIPDHHTNLLRPARDLSQHLLQRLAPTASFADCAHRLHNLGVRLAAVGELRAALEPVREAVKIYRALAEAEPAAYLPALAMSLNNLGVRLAEVGEQRDALELAREAVKIYRALAEAEPAAYLPTLAGSLNNLGNCLAEVGEQRDALQPVREAVEIRRRLAEAEPAAYLPTLALSLNTLGNRLAEVGEQRDALELVREAVEIRRRLAGAEPAAYLPALAMSLNNLGVRLAEVGEQRDALE